MIERLEAIVSGKVQGVMFRDFVQRKAIGLCLTGEVWNEKDGTVRVLAEGEHAALEIFLKKLHRGSIHSRVDSVTANWISATNEYVSFQIIHNQS